MFQCKFISCLFNLFLYVVIYICTFFLHSILPVIYYNVTKLWENKPTNLYLFFVFILSAHTYNGISWIYKNETTCVTNEQVRYFFHIIILVRLKICIVFSTWNKIFSLKTLTAKTTFVVDFHSHRPFLKRCAEKEKSFQIKFNHLPLAFNLNDINSPLTIITKYYVKNFLH